MDAQKYDYPYDPKDIITLDIRETRSAIVPNTEGKEINYDYSNISPEKIIK
jgi:hypothetical protein